MPESIPKFRTHGDQYVESAFSFVYEDYMTMTVCSIVSGGLGSCMSGSSRVQDKNIRKRHARFEQNRIGCACLQSSIIFCDFEAGVDRDADGCHSVVMLLRTQYSHDVRKTLLYLMHVYLFGCGDCSFVIVHYLMSMIQSLMTYSISPANCVTGSLSISWEAVSSSPNEELLSMISTCSSSKLSGSSPYSKISLRGIMSESHYRIVELRQARGSAGCCYRSLAWWAWSLRNQPA